MSSGEYELKPVNTGDGVALKAQLDDSIIKVLQDEGFNEEHFWSNVKLVLLTAASAVALIAQFYPMPFPESRTLLATCCTLYVVFNVILQIIAWVVEQDKIAIMAAPAASEGGSRLRIVVRTSLPRFDHMFTAVFEDGDTGAQLFKLHDSVGSYFTQDGDFAEELFEQKIADGVAEARRETAKDR